MVNTGRPSGRCLPCKDDKTKVRLLLLTTYIAGLFIHKIHCLCAKHNVKCDLKKPICGRCTRLRKSCGGYPDQWNLIHREQDQIAALRVQSRVTKRRAERGQEQRAPDSRGSFHATSAAVLAPPIPRPLDFSVEIYCIPRLFNDYSSNSGIAVYDALPALTSAGPASCYPHALNAVAVASSSGLLRQPRLLTKARVSYGMAMSNLQKAIMEPESLRDDSVLQTLFMLGFFEVVTQSLFDSRLKTIELNCDPHSSGARTLMQYRINNGIDTLVDQNIFIFNRNVRLMQIFMADKSPASLVEDFMHPFSAWKHIPALESIIMESVLWVADLGNPTDLRPSYDGSSVAETVSILVNRARNLILRLVQVTESISTSQESIYFNGIIAVRNQTSAAIARSHYRTVAIHLMDMAVSLLHVSCSVLQADTLERGLVDLVNWEALREDLLVAVSSSPGDPIGTPVAAQALIMAWPMTAIARSKIAPLDTRLIAQASLRHGANSMHISKP